MWRCCCYLFPCRCSIEKIKLSSFFRSISIIWSPFTDGNKFTPYWRWLYSSENVLVDQLFDKSICKCMYKMIFIFFIKYNISNNLTLVLKLMIIYLPRIRAFLFPYSQLFCALQVLNL